MSNCFERKFHGHDGLKARPSLQSSDCRRDPDSPGGKIHLEKTLALTDGNRTHAAEMLGISLRTMRNKIREYGFPQGGMHTCRQPLQ